MSELPAAFISTMGRTYGKAGLRWASDLPFLLAEAAGRWGVTPGRPFDLSYNYVCSATCRDGTPVVLKIGFPTCELESEIRTLATYEGEGACRLLEADAGRGMLLLERLQPGTMLSSLEDDDQATEIAADLMRRIRRPEPGEGGFLSLRGWFDGLKGLRPRFAGGTGPFPERTLAIAEGLLHDLLSEETRSMLLHGDFHHDNVLLSSRGWLAIDPKGVVGPPEYEAGPLLMNPWDSAPAGSEAIARSRRRIAILAERLGYAPRRLRAWAICHSVLSAWWDLAEDGSGTERSLAWAEIFLKMQV